MNGDRIAKSRYDYARMVVTTLLFFSFIVLFSMSWGKFVYMSLAIVLFLLFAAHNNMKIPVSIDAFHLLTSAFVLFCFASALWAIDPGKVLGPTMTLLRTMICMYVVYCSFQNDKDITVLIDSIMWAGFLMVLYTIQYYGVSGILGVIISGKRLLNEVINSNAIGMFASLSVVIWFSRILQKQLNAVIGILIPPSIMVVIASGSRKAITLILLGFFLIYYRNRTGTTSKKNKLLQIMKPILIILGFAILLFLLSNVEILKPTFNRFAMMLNGFTDSGKVDASTETRMLLIGQGMDAFWKHPILGIGIGNAPEVIGRNMYFHNNYVELLATGGIAGASLYYAMYIYAGISLYRVRDYRDNNSDISVFMLIMLIIMDYGQVSYTAKDTYFYLIAIFLQIRILRQSNVRHYE